MEQLNRHTKLSYRVVFPLELRLFNKVGLLPSGGVTGANISTDTQVNDWRHIIINVHFCNITHLTDHILISYLFH